MDLYNALKPAFMVFVVVISAVRMGMHFAKNDMKKMWIMLGLGAFAVFFISDPQKVLNAGNGLMQSLTNWISTLGG